MQTGFTMSWEPWVLMRTEICTDGAPCITSGVNQCVGCLGDGRRALVESVVNVNVAVDGNGDIFALNSEWKSENE
jgi:hypothetical protein